MGHASRATAALPNNRLPIFRSFCSISFHLFLGLCACFVLCRSWAAISIRDVDAITVKISAPDGSLLSKRFDLETYVSGVILGELPSEWPTEALKAQAVVARTFAVARIQSGAKTLRSTVLDQVFRDPNSISISAEWRDRTRNASRSTEGEVLSAGAAMDRVFPTHYHADCGGATEEPKAIWGAGPELGVARDAGCPIGRTSKWRVFLAWEKLLSGFEKEERSLAVLERLPSGRIAKLELRHGSRRFALTGEQLRARIGYGIVKSTLFEIERQSPEGVWISGRGFGHGAGLCQWGARRMALKGATYREILAHYYPKLRLVSTR